MYYPSYRYTTHVLSKVEIHYTCTVEHKEMLHMYYHTYRYATHVLSHVQIHYTCTMVQKYKIVTVV
jgi:hypothetical protein